VRATKPDERRDGRLAPRPVGKLYVIRGHHSASRISELERTAQFSPALKRQVGLLTRKSGSTESDVCESSARGLDKVLQGHVARQWLHGNRKTLARREHLDLPDRHAVMSDREHCQFLTAISVAV
jgi:hypothetical protein